MADNLPFQSEATRANSRVLDKIATLEATQARAIREFILGDPSAKGRLQAIDNQIAAFRGQLQQE